MIFWKEIPVCGKSSKPSGSEEIERWVEGRAAWTRIGVTEAHSIEAAGIGPSVLCWLGVQAEQIQFALFLFCVARANCSSDDVVCRQGRTYTGKAHTVPRHDRESQALARWTPARLPRQSAPSGLQIKSLKSLPMQLVQCENTHD